MAQSILTIDHANHLLLEQSLIRLPHELLHKNFRSANFIIQKDSTYIKSILKETATSASSGKISSTEDVLKNIDLALARARGIKRKLSKFAEEEQEHYRNLDTRLDHLSQLKDMHTLDDVKYEAWSKQRLDRLVADYLLRQGFLESARQLTESKKLEGLVDVGIFEEISTTRQALLDGSLKEALDWCAENKKELRKADTNLEFQLRLQQYIELVRTQDPTKLFEALTFARKHLLPYRDSHATEYTAVGILLAYPSTEPHWRHPTAAALYSPSRWTMLANLYTTTYHTLLSLPQTPLLNIALHPGLSALKTPHCHAASREMIGAPNNLAAATDTTKRLCPICSKELNELARCVPYAHHSQSHVEADLVMMPNGRMYKREKVDECTLSRGLNVAEQAVDPGTGEIHAAKEVQKVYIT